MVRILILVLVVSLYPALKRTYDWSNNAHGLVTLATWKEDEFTLNPYDRSGYLITPDVAKWLLLNFDYPYGRCSEIMRVLACDMPLINYVGAGLGYGDNRSIEAGYEILHHLIDRGESLESRHDGYTPLHEAIIYCDSRLIKSLVLAGANIEAIIDDTESKLNGLSAIKLAKHWDDLKTHPITKNCETLNAIITADDNQ